MAEMIKGPIDENAVTIEDAKPAKTIGAVAIDMKTYGIPLSILNPDVNGDGKVEAWEKECFARLKKADADNSGTIDVHELYSIMKSAVSTEKSRRMYQRLFCLSTFLLVALLLLGIVGNAVVSDQMKESRVSSGGMMTGNLISHPGGSGSSRRRLDGKTRPKSLLDEVPMGATMPVSTETPVHELDIHDLGADKIKSDKLPMKHEDRRRLKKKEYEYDYMSMLEKVKDVPLFIDGSSRRRLAEVPDSPCGRRLHGGRSLTELIGNKEDTEMTFKVESALKSAEDEATLLTSTGAVIKINSATKRIKVEVDGVEYDADDQPKVPNRRRMELGMRQLSEHVTKKKAKASGGTAGLSEVKATEPMLKKMTPEDEDDLGPVVA